jgi:hypothetical protein
MADDGFSEEELGERVLYAGLRGVARWARAVRSPLKAASQLFDVAYFQTLRSTGMPIRDIADRLGVGLRRAATLSKALKGNFSNAERAHTLPRRIEFVLWAGPLGVRRIRQALGGDVALEAVEAALERLMADGRIVREDGRTPTYRVARAESRMARDTWLARIDALDLLLATVGDAVVARFLADEDRAFARTLSLRVRRADLPALRALYEETIWPALVQLDAAAKDDADSEALNLALLWAPRDFIERYDDTNAKEES